MGRRIEYIDGLKGLCGIWVCLYHYIVAFFPAGFIGWGSGIADSEKCAAYFGNFPVSIVKNASFPLYVFFALVAFIPALNYFRSGSDAGIRRQAVKRYFRLMPPVLACALFGYAVWASGGMFNRELAADVACNWDRAFYTADLSLAGALFNGVFDAFWTGNSDYCSVLWCLNVIFFGSYLSYAVLLMFGQLRSRWAVYAVLFCLSYMFPQYAAFVAGIAAADLVANGAALKPRGLFGACLVALGIFAGNFPPVLMPNLQSVYMSFGAASMLVIWGCAESGAARRILSAGWLRTAGRLSFSLVLVHFTVLMSLSAWLFHASLGAGFPFWAAIALSWGLSLPVIAALSWLFEKFIERPSERFANRVLRFLS